MISEATRKLLIASKVRGVGRRTLHDLAEERLFFELPMDAWHLDLAKLKSLMPDSPAYDKVLSAADLDIETSERMGGTILSVRDALYPKLLRSVKDSPAILYVRGDPSLFSDRAVAIIGTREPSQHGRLTAERISKHFASLGWQIVSGLAIGLDSVAHEAALAAGGSTVAVLAHGLDSVYPKQNADLAARILEKKGLLVSEYPYGTPGFPAHFVERDRIQAALARGVVMVQSGETGGSWYASQASLSYGRWLFVPEPTKQDLESSHPKTLGNIAMAQGSLSTKMQLLKCKASDLDRLVILRSRDDYPSAEHNMLSLPSTDGLA